MSEIGTPGYGPLKFEFWEELGLDTEYISAYRQFMPRRDIVEYTVFFRKGGEKQRIDMNIDVEVLTRVSDPEKYMLRLTALNIEFKNYRKATEAFQ